MGSMKTVSECGKQFFLCLCVVFLASCGYTQQVKLPNDIKTIAVPTFQDEIPPDQRYAYRPGLEVELTNAIIDRLIFDGNLKVVDETKADAILSGNIIAYQQEGLRFDDRESVEEYRLFLVVNFELIDQRNKEVLLEEPNFSGRAEFFTSRSPAGVRRTAANDAVTDLARSLVDRIVEGW
jgi:outer membrane lipopolysaccharide assembly protein LptE/RlpB